MIRHYIVLLGAMMLLVSSLRPLTAEDLKPKTTLTAQDLKPEDQAKIAEINRQASEISKDVELAQTKLQLDQARMDRLNEVTLPALVAQIRRDYNKPETEWDFDLKSFTFNKKPDPPKDTKK